MSALPQKVVDRVNREFAHAERPEVHRLLESFCEDGNENWESRVWNEILDRAQGNLLVVKSLIKTAKSDPRDLFYSSRSDPYMLIGKLLKNLRFLGTLTTGEVAEARHQLQFSPSRYESAFAFI